MERFAAGAPTMQGQDDHTGFPFRACAVGVATLATVALGLIGCNGTGGATTAAGTAAARAPHASKHCDLVASPAGHNRASGSAKHPVRSLGRLVRGLHHGQTGCLLGGTYRGATSRQLKLGRRGVTLRSFPGERATVRGAVWVAGSGVTLRGLNLDGANPLRTPSPVLSGDRTTLVRDHITNHHEGICVSLGALGYNTPHRTVIRDNRIHDCGRIHPATNQDHGIYVAYADHTLIRNNVIAGNADRGIQLYPSAQHTRIVGNVIDGNGEGVIFGGGAHTASSHTRIERNLITNSRLRGNVESAYAAGEPVGHDNVVRFNCISGARADYPGLNRAGVQSPPTGFRASNNVATPPGYVDRAHGRFRLAKASPCRGLGRPVHLTASSASVLRGEIPGARGGQPHDLQVQARGNGSWDEVGSRRVFTRRFQVRLGSLHGAGGPTLVRVALAGRPRSNAVRVTIEHRAADRGTRGSAR